MVNEPGGIFGLPHRNLNVNGVDKTQQAAAGATKKVQLLHQYLWAEAGMALTRQQLERLERLMENPAFNLRNSALTLACQLDKLNLEKSKELPPIGADIKGSLGIIETQLQVIQKTYGAAGTIDTVQNGQLIDFFQNLREQIAQSNRTAEQNSQLQNNLLLLMNKLKEALGVAAPEATAPKLAAKPMVEESSLKASAPASMHQTQIPQDPANDPGSMMDYFAYMLLEIDFPSWDSIQATAEAAYEGSNMLISDMNAVSAAEEAIKAAKTGTQLAAAKAQLTAAVSKLSNDVASMKGPSWGGIAANNPNLDLILSNIKAAKNNVLPLSINNPGIAKYCNYLGDQAKDGLNITSAMGTQTQTVVSQTNSNFSQITQLFGSFMSTENNMIQSVAKAIGGGG